DFPSYLPKLTILYVYLFAGGKGFRSRLTSLVCAQLEVPKEKVLLLCQTIEFIHNASLLHDDLIDRSHLRRGKTTAWLKYTPEYAVLAGDYLLARVMVNLSSHGNVKLIHYTAEMISDLLEGEWIQDSLVGEWNVELAQLDQVHNLKTGSLFKWCLRAPFVLKEIYDEEVHELLEEMGGILGLLFQRSDDLLDFDIRNHEGKALLGDLKSGYINSFGAFLTEDFDSQQRKAFAGCESLDAVKLALGDKVFADRLQHFDQMNKDLIDRYHHYVSVLEGLESFPWKGLLKDLAKLPDPLYWRKKSGEKS
ncbi:MAG: polyprenyl synthetase family protein, partial [Pseudomonadota bacterium]